MNKKWNKNKNLKLRSAMKNDSRVHAVIGIHVNWYVSVGILLRGWLALSFFLVKIPLELKASAYDHFDMTTYDHVDMTTYDHVDVTVQFENETFWVFLSHSLCKITAVSMRRKYSLLFFYAAQDTWRYIEYVEMHSKFKILKYGEDLESRLKYRDNI